MTYEKSPSEVTTPDEVGTRPALTDCIRKRSVTWPYTKGEMASYRGCWVFLGGSCRPRRLPSLLVFFAKDNQMCGSCRGQRSGAPLEKCGTSKHPKSNLFSSTSSFQGQQACVIRLLMIPVCARVKHFQVANFFC